MNEKQTVRFIGRWSGTALALGLFFVLLFVPRVFAAFILFVSIPPLFYLCGFLIRIIPYLLAGLGLFILPAFLLIGFFLLMPFIAVPWGILLSFRNHMKNRRSSKKKQKVMMKKARSICDPGKRKRFIADWVLHMETADIEPSQEGGNQSEKDSENR